MSLNAKAIDGMDAEGSALALWQEYLAGYFDGGAHLVGRASVVFPKATLRFQEASLPQPLRGLGISVVWVTQVRVERRWEVLTAAELALLPAGTPAEQERMQAHCSFLFLVRAVDPPSPGSSPLRQGSGGQAGAASNAQQQVQVAAGKLFGLLQNTAATEPLSEKGISKIRPTPGRMAFPGDGAPGADQGYRLRVLSCRAILRWAVASQ